MEAGRRAEVARIERLQAILGRQAIRDATASYDAIIRRREGQGVLSGPPSVRHGALPSTAAATEAGPSLGPRIPTPVDIGPVLRSVFDRQLAEARRATEFRRQEDAVFRAQPITSTGIRSIEDTIRQQEDREEQDREHFTTLNRLRRQYYDAEVEDLQEVLERRGVLETGWQASLLDASQDLAIDLGSSISKGFDDIIFEGETFSDTLSNIWRDLTRNLLRETINNLIQTQLTQTAASGLSSLISAGIGAGIGSFFGGANLPPQALSFAGLNASLQHGGPVVGGGHYLVGEAGPEIFTPNVSGFVTPNHALGGGGTTVINVNQNIYTDNSAIYREILNATPRIVDQAVNRVQQVQSRPGGGRRLS